MRAVITLAPIALVRVTELTGRAVINLGRVLSELARILERVLYYTFHGHQRPALVLEQLYQVGNRSLFFITVTLGFVGMILVFQACFQAQRFINDFSLIGPGLIQYLTREFGPTICALMVATRVGSGIAAMVGSMVVTEQVDALRMCAADPIDYLLVPRVKACLVMVTVLSAYGVAVAVAAGALTAHYGFGVSYETFLSVKLVDGWDLATGLIKAVLYGLAIPVIAGHCGLTARGGSEGVGWATTRAVVNCSLAVIFLDLVVSGFAYLVFPK